MSLSASHAMPRFAAITASLLCIRFGAGCAIEHASATQEELLALPYQQFDQTSASGWRAFSDQRRYREAAGLIEVYLKRHVALPADQRVILHFHAAQAFAFAGETAAALTHLQQARLESEPPDSPVRWNDYVLATEAFLQQDRARLLSARERMAIGSSVDGEVPNLKVVDSLIAHFGDPYAIAYRAQR